MVALARHGAQLLPVSVSSSPMTALVVNVSASETHAFSKQSCEVVTLLPGLGIFNDAHCGETVKHRSRVARDPGQPNLRQVHLIHEELFHELLQNGFSVVAAELGENITTRGIALLELPTGTKLHIGSSAVVELTGLRNPCIQIERFQKGLQAAVLGRTKDGSLVRKAGVMGVVAVGGTVCRGNRIAVELPPLPHRPLEPV